MDKKLKDILIKLIINVVKSNFNFIIPIRGTIVSIDSTYRCTIRLLDATSTSDNRTNVIIPAYISGTLSALDDVEIYVQNGNYNYMEIHRKVQ